MEISEMGVLKMLDAIEVWQGDPNHHELTCSGGGGECSDVKMVGKMIATSSLINISGQDGSKLVLECPKCGRIQENVPNCVYQWYIDTHMSHDIPLGQVVEVELTDGCGMDSIYYGEDYVFEREIGGKVYGSPDEGVKGDKEIALCFLGTLKALVVGYTRDCDGTACYYLSHKRIKYNCGGMHEKFRNKMHETRTYRAYANYLSGPWSADSLKICEGEFVPLLYNSVYEYEDMLEKDLQQLRELAESKKQDSSGVSTNPK
jgi:hypothetical protein